jgi:two-component system, OmpR family, response regulator RegX3
MHIAILEDDAYQRQFLTMLVETGGHRASGFAQGSEFLASLDNTTYDLLLLDWMMPEMSGDQVLAAVRQRFGMELPVMVVTARDAESDVVTALRQGADDFIVKPPKTLELLARMEALTRRARSIRSGVLRLGAYEIDPERRAVTLSGKPIALTQKEFDLAVFLFQNPGRLLSRVKLLEQVWGVSAELDTRTVDTHVSRVRRKLQLDADTGWKLLPVYGFGYRLDPVDPA